MKTKLSIIVLLAGVIFCAGCSGQDKSNPTTETVVISESEAKIITGAIVEADFIFTDKGLSFPLMSKLDDLIVHFGDDYQVNAAVSCAFVGEDKEILYDGLSIYTNPIDGGDTIGEILVSGTSYLTPRGIGVGATRDEVEAAYGPGFDEQGVLVYISSGIEGDLEAPRLSFFFDSQGKVESISYFIALYTQF